jgi:hypothetical protein
VNPAIRLLEQTGGQLAQSRRPAIPMAQHLHRGLSDCLY